MQLVTIAYSLLLLVHKRRRCLVSQVGYLCLGSNLVGDHVSGLLDGGDLLSTWWYATSQDMSC